MRVRISSRARGDLEAIWDYSADIWGEARADAYLDALLVRFQWLTRNEPLWQRRDDLGDGVFGWTEQSHLVVFRQVDDAVEVIRVLHVRVRNP